ncbi:MAG: carboxymuconolactone decarboxylase family protein [Pseudohongiellaceae bacterium]
MNFRLSNAIIGWISLALMTTALADVEPADYEGRDLNGGIPIRLDTPRIEPVDPDNMTPAQSQALSGSIAQRGGLMNVFGTIGQYPEIYSRWIAFAGYVRSGVDIDLREAELLICRIAWLTNAEYEWSAHTARALNAGMTGAEILMIAEGPEAEGWGERDRLLMWAADEMHADAFISEATWNGLRQFYSDRQLMDVVFTAASYHMLAYALNSFGVQLEPGAEGFPDNAEITDMSGGRSGRVSKVHAQPSPLASPRIPSLSDSEWSAEQRELLAPMQAERGSVPNIYRTMVQNPDLYIPRLEFGRYFQRESTLPARERELLICRIAVLTNAEYEWSAHTAYGLDAGLSREELTRLKNTDTFSGWETNDLALIRATDQLHETAFITDEVWDTLAETYSEKQMMEIVFTIGAYHMLAVALNSFGVPLEDNPNRFADF